MKTPPKKPRARKSAEPKAAPAKIVPAKPAKPPGGIVGFCLHGPAAALGGKGASPALAPGHLVQIIQAGLAVSELEDLRTSLGLPMDKLATRLGISKATLHRRKARGKLEADESDRVVRFARLMGRALEVMESQEHARRWLTSPQVGLGGEVPLNYAGTEIGAREVEDLLGRIEHGVYS